MKTVLLSILALVLLTGSVAWIWLRHFERSRLYHPETEINQTPAHFQLRFQKVDFKASDDTPLTGWWIPANRPRGTVVYCHGNAGNISTVAELAPEFFRRRLNLLLWDYRGYGASGGQPSEKGLYRDACAAFDAARAMSGSLPILIYGQSLGGAVAAYLATQKPAAGLIIEGSFSSAADLARRWYPSFPMDRLLSVSFDSASRLAELKSMPKLIGHSPDDSVVPFQSGRILHAAAADPKVFTLLAGDHNNRSWFTPGAAGNADLDAFIDSVTRN